MTWYEVVNLPNMRLHARAAIPRPLAKATHSIHPAALFGRGVGTTLPQPACSPEGDSMHTHLIPYLRKISFSPIGNRLKPEVKLSILLIQQENILSEKQLHLRINE